MANKLTLGDLQRPDRAFRIPLLVSKLHKQDEFVLMDNTKRKFKFIKINKEIIDVKKASSTGLTQLETKLRSVPPKTIVELSNDGQQFIAVSKLMKTAEFGGGSGSRGSAVTTAQQEEGSLLYFEYYIESDTFPTTEEILAIYPDVSDGWISTFEQQSKALKMYLSSNKQYNYYRGSGIVDTIKQVARDVGVRGDINAWNPADVYLVKKQHEETIKQQLQKIASDYSDIDSVEKGIGLKKLNYEMITLLNDKKLIPISLKGTRQGIRRAYVTENNLAETVKETFNEYSINNNTFVINLDVDNNTFKTVDTSFRLNVEGDLQGNVPVQNRFFGSPTSRRITSQIELGKFSGKGVGRLGKVPTSKIDDFLTSNNEVRKKASDLPRPDNWTQIDINNYVRIFQEMTSSRFTIEWGKSVTDAPSFRSFLEHAIEYEKENTSESRVFSGTFGVKLQGIHLIHTLIKFDARERDGRNLLQQFLELLFLGSQKLLTGSGPFIKIA